MIELHSHILYETDDGSSSLEESIEMAKEAFEAGFTTICCTPHYLEPQYVHTREENLEKLNILQNKLEQRNIDIKLELGNEIFITRNIEELIDAKKASMLGESEYILIELPMFQRLTSAINLISDLPYSKIILAHPERYEYVQDNISYLDEFIDMGILLQGNYESILGKYGRKAEKTLKKLLKQHKVDLLSTDTHRKNSTYARFLEIEKKLKKLVKEDYYKDLTYNLPKDILRNI